MTSVLHHRMSGGFFLTQETESVGLVTQLCDVLSDDEAVEVPGPPLSCVPGTPETWRSRNARNQMFQELPETSRHDLHSFSHYFERITTYFNESIFGLCRTRGRSDARPAADPPSHWAAKASSGKSALSPLGRAACFGI